MNGTTYYLKDIFSMDLKNPSECQWLPVNHVFFQIANVFLVLTYVINPSSLFGLLQLRLALTMAGFFFGVWGGTVLCSIDCMSWNSAFAIGNAVHIVFLLFKLRPICFHGDHEMIYKAIFEPVGVKRFQYKELALLGQRLCFQGDEMYAEQGVTKSDHIGIVVVGSFEVSFDGSVISHIKSLEFIDSPEWIATENNIHATYQVSLSAVCPSVVYVWKREELKKLFRSDFVLKNVIDSLVGQDICKKLFSLHESFANRQLDVQHNHPSVLKKASLITYSAANLLELCANNNAGTDNNNNRSSLVPLHLWSTPRCSVISSVSCSKENSSRPSSIASCHVSDVSNDGLTSSKEPLINANVSDTKKETPTKSSSDVSTQNCNVYSSHCNGGEDDAPLLGDAMLINWNVPLATGLSSVRKEDSILPGEKVSLLLNEHFPCTVDMEDFEHLFVDVDHLIKDDSLKETHM